ncbi:MAG TPA: CHAD domain-containing protein [Acidimicrobiales bacterium]|nr:CHAD domain-containing protein [Acidimicrobiales bacterium]
MPERGANPTHVEVEWQLDALDLRPVERWLGTFPRVVPGTGIGSTHVVTVETLPVKRTVDVYLDTEDWRIGRSGFVLRIRHHADQGEVTLKDTAPAVAGLRRRLEVTQPLPAAGLHDLDPQGPVGRRLRALAGDAPLTHLLEIRTRRRPYLLHAAEERLGEMDLDDTIIVVGDDEYPVRMRRVELEVDPRWVELLTPLVDQLRQECGLQSAILSKFEVGLLAAGLRVPETPYLGPTTLPDTPSVGTVAYTVLRRNLGSMLAHEAGTRLGEDIEQLHDMRVATRRLRAALDLFEGVLPGHAHRLHDELGWLAAELGAVRDLDVQLERLEQWRHQLSEQQAVSLGELADVLERERDGARQTLLASLDSARYERLVSEFTSMLQAGPDQGPSRLVKAAQAPAVAVVPGLILGRHRSAANAARRARRSGVPADFHRLRIRCKRLRYALEFVSEIYEGKTRPFVKHVVGLQDCLGLMQDGQVAADRLLALATAENSGLSPAAVFVMGAVAERYRHDVERLVQTLPDQLQAVKGRRWRKLKALMERRRLEAGPSQSWSPPPSTPADQPADPRVPERIPPTPFPHASPSPTHPAVTSDDDPDWDDECGPALRSVPVVADDGDEPTFLDGPRPPAAAAAAPPIADPPGGRRRKEPVFLPAPPVGGRPTAVRPVPHTEPPAPHSEPSGGGQDRSFPDRP